MKRKLILCLIFFNTFCMAKSLAANQQLVWQPGDWFEVKMIIKKTYTVAAKSEGEKMLRTSENTTLWLKLMMGDKLPNGHYSVSMDVIRHKMLRNDGVLANWYGFDSYYPDFEQRQQLTSFMEVSKFDSYNPNLEQDKRTAQIRYDLEVSSKGEVISIEPQGDYYIPLSQISVVKKFDSSLTITGQMFAADQVKAALQMLFQLPDKKFPPVIASDATEIWPIAASSPISDNVCIQGIIHQANTSNLRIDGKTVQLDKDGRFIFTTLLERDRELTVVLNEEKMNEEKVTVFLSAGDILGLEGMAGKWSETLRFSGNAARKAAFAHQIQPFLSSRKSLLKQNPSEMMADQKKRKQSLMNLIEQYKKEIPDREVEYYRRRLLLKEVSDKLVFLKHKFYQLAEKGDKPFHGFPKDFFSSIDTLPVQAYIHQSDELPANYVENYMEYEMAKIGVSYYQTTFDQKYNFLLMTMKGYGLYNRLSDILYHYIIDHSQAENERIKTYVADFLSTCGDTVLSGNIKRAWEWNERWKVGSPYPIEQFTLTDGSVFSLKPYKGKVICLVLSDNFDIKEQEAYARFMQRKENQDVQFIIAYTNWPVDSQQQALERRKYFEGLPNVKLVELAERTQEGKKEEMPLPFQTWCFLDKWQRITADHVPAVFSRLEPDGNMEPFKMEVYLDEARAADRFSEEDKAEAMKAFGWGGGSVLLTCLVGGVIYRSNLRGLKRKAEAKRKLKELEIRAIRAQMNPHFIFNALNSIQSLITENRLEEANLYLVEFSALLRAVLQHADKNTIPLSDELEMVERYCKLEQLRFNFSYMIDIAPDVETAIIEIPTMVLQPLVENAVFHGLMPLVEGKGELKINISLHANELMIAVLDNGVGLMNGTTQKMKGNGKGLQLVRERLSIFQPKETAMLTVQNRGIGINKMKGTESLLTFHIMDI